MQDTLSLDENAISNTKSLVDCGIACDSNDCNLFVHNQEEKICSLYLVCITFLFSTFRTWGWGFKIQKTKPLNSDSKFRLTVKLSNITEIQEQK